LRNTNISSWGDYKKHGKNPLPQMRGTTKKWRKTHLKLGDYKKSGKNSYLKLGGLQKKWEKTHISSWRDYKKV
jgi:hypothetical protein